MKDRYLFHCRAWRIIVRLTGPLVRGKFNIENETLNVDGPCLVISNHVTDWDPLMLAQSFPEKQIYYVASEHIFRLGLISRLINYLLEPIARRKASMGTDTVMSCLRHLRAGHSVCIFAEGDASWDGLSHEIFSSTGKLARNSGASLITYRLEGAYLSRPRWSRKIYKGKVKGHPVGVYSPEQLKAMTPAQITAQINSDIFENAWERQKEEKTVYKNDGIADGIAQALYMCPGCRKIGTISGKGRRVSCTCGFSVSFNEYGSFEPPKPFANVYEWDKWQSENILPADMNTDTELFSDEELTLREIHPDHSEVILCTGTARMFRERLTIGEHSFPLKEIQMMALVQKKALLFSADGKYYELKAKNVACMRKYLTVWNKIKNDADR